jgi:hypothetical protein
VDQIRFQPPRQALVATHGGRVNTIQTITIPAYTATDEAVEELRKESLKRYGIPYRQAKRNVEEPSTAGEHQISLDDISFYGH